ncbi:hypothetical protein [Streptomyces sp. NPDC054975]
MPDTPRTGHPALADALNDLADRMDAHAGPLSHVGLANLLARVIDGPQATGSTRITQPELMKEATKAVVTHGFLSPVPDARQVRAAAAAARGDQ